MANLWTKIDIRVIQNPPVYLTAGDECYYAREFIAHGGYSAGDGNQCISNFKKKPETRNTNQWPHRMRAVEQFAAEVSLVIPRDATVATIPTSKIRGQPGYCDRFDELMVRLGRRRSDIIVVEPIVRSQAGESLHVGARTRRVEEELAKIRWVGFSGTAPLRLYLIDDVITAGTMFKACKRLILQHNPRTVAVGLFWARTVWPDADSPGDA